MALNLVIQMSININSLFCVPDVGQGEIYRYFAPGKTKNL